MLKTYYHGTSADNLKSILKDGLTSYNNKIWTCSENGVYLWDVEALAIANGRDLIDDVDMLEDEAFRMANESGQIACACAKDCRIVVLKIQIDDSETNIDYSCENMDSSGAVVVYRDILLSEIKEIHVSNDLSLIKGYFISIIDDRDYNNLEFNRIEKKISSLFKNGEIYPDDIDDIIEFKQIKLNKNKKATLVM